jgi:hypothetical protein
VELHGGGCLDQVKEGKLSLSLVELDLGLCFAVESLFMPPLSKEIIVIMICVVSKQIRLDLHILQSMMNN